MRTGDTPTTDSLYLFSTTETVQGSIALFNTLESNTQQFDVVRMPEFLASDMVNIVPRIILPKKDDIRVTAEERGFVLDNPLGGLNVAVSLLINFGSIGSLVVVTLLGLTLSRLRRRAMSPRAVVHRVTYAVIAATMLMSFYRDFFSITVVRWWILTGLMIPSFLSLAMRFFGRRELTANKSQHELSLLG